MCEQLIDIRQASKLLGISVLTLRTWVGARKIPFVRLGRRVLFDRQDLAVWVGANKVQPRSRREVSP
jgi:excisionase family DNA binding protein